VRRRSSEAYCAAAFVLGGLRFANPPYTLNMVSISIGSTQFCADCLPEKSMQVRL
jgi:hypothetical protein